MEKRILILSDSPTHTNDIKNALQTIKDSTKEIELGTLLY